MNFRLWIPALILLIASSAIPAEDVAVDAEAFSGIYVKAADTEYDYDTQGFRADGNAILKYNDISLTADSVTGNAGTGDFEASGNVTFSQGERVVKGQKFVYNYKTKTGHSTDASASADNILFHGDEMDCKPDGYSLTGSRFTTCNEEKPHYYLSARELIIRPDDRLIARDVRIVVLGKTLLKVPKYVVRLKKKERRGMRLPLVGISGKCGPYLSHTMDVSSKPGLSGKLALRLSTGEAFQGGLKMSQVAGSPVVLNLTYREPFYGGLNPDTVLTRMPEVAYRFADKGTLDTRDESDAALYLTRTILDPTSEMESRGRFHMIGEAGIGHFKEEPSLVESMRFDVRAMGWIDPIEVGGNIVVPGILTRFSHYDTGDDYAALGLQLAAARKLGADSYVSLTYVTHAISGKTPFQFDPIEIPHELAGRLRFPVGSFAIELGARYDMQHGSLFDSEISISKPIHCVEPKFTWRNRFKEFSLGMGLVGF